MNNYEMVQSLEERNEMTGLTAERGFLYDQHIDSTTQIHRF
jgi:hypothetical protein